MESPTKSRKSDVNSTGANGEGEIVRHFRIARLVAGAASEDAGGDDADGSESEDSDFSEAEEEEEDALNELRELYKDKYEDELGVFCFDLKPEELKEEKPEVMEVDDTPASSEESGTEKPDEEIPSAATETEVTPSTEQPQTSEEVDNAPSVSSEESDASESELDTDEEDEEEDTAVPDPFVNFKTGAANSEREVICVESIISL